MANWKYQLKFSSPASVFSGLAVAGLLDRMIVRTHKRKGSGGHAWMPEKPCIPGSSVKGRWRFFAERLLNTPGVEGEFNMHDPDGPECKDPANCCTICGLFGNPSIPSAIWVGDASPAIEDEALEQLLQQAFEENRNPVFRPDGLVRPGIALDRARRVALPDHLFFDEAVSYVSFVGEIMVKRRLSQEETRFLTASARFVDRIGGRKAVGRGALDGGIDILNGADKNKEVAR